MVSCERQLSGDECHMPLIYREMFCKLFQMYTNPYAKLILEDNIPSGMRELIRLS